MTDAVRSLEASSPGSEGSTLASASLPPGSASTTSTAEPCSSATGPESRSTPTCESSEPTPHESTCSTADTPASPSASPESAKAPTTHATSGPSSPDSFAYYDPESSSLRTSQATFDLGFTPSLPTLPPWGWMSAGELYERPMPEPLTNEHGSSSLLPTPVAQDDQKQPAAHLAKKVESGAGETITSLTVMSRQFAQTGEWSNKLLPTPTGDDANNVTRESGEFQSLARTAHSLLPTPNASDGPNGGPNRADGKGVPYLSGIKNLLPTPTTQDAANNGGPSQHDRNTPPLNTAVKLLPTPVRTDAAAAARHTTTTGVMHGGTSLTDWTRQLPGASTNPPSNGGKTSSDEPPHAQLTIEDA